MKHLKQSIKEYLDTWLECSVCNYMCKIKLIIFRENKPVCKDCNCNDYLGETTKALKEFHKSYASETRYFSSLIQDRKIKDY